MSSLHPNKNLQLSLYSSLPFVVTDLYLIYFILILRADEEPVDQKKYLEESCKPKCVRQLLEYQVCVDILENFKLAVLIDDEISYDYGVLLFISYQGLYINS